MAVQALGPLAMQMKQQHDMKEQTEKAVENQKQTQLVQKGAGTISCPGFEESYARQIPMVS